MVKTNFQFPQSFFYEEEKCGYKISTQMKEIWAINLDLLNEFMDVCKKYDLQFWADAGTLLGCARHKGFIPWDDDIDLVMPRKDFDKFCKIAKKEFKYPYFFQTEKTDIGSLKWFAKICNSETTSMFKNFMDREFTFNQGIAIDIMPLDNIPDDKTERIAFFKQLNELQDRARKFANTTYRYVFHSDKSNKSIKVIKNVMKVFFRSILIILRIPNPYHKKISSMSQKYNHTRCKCFGTNIFKPEPESDKGCLEISDFEETVLLPFEMFELPCPKNYNNVLQNYYGTWNEYVSGGSYHSNVFYDTNNSYKKYIHNNSTGGK